MPQSIYVFDRQSMSDGKRAIHSSADGLPNLCPGDILIYDFRDTSTAPIEQPRATSLKVVQWNIERGYKLEGIIDELKALDADVITLQELDISCSRTKHANVPLAIAEALGGVCVFVCEFQEFRSSCTCRRSAENEVDSDWAYHGNAIVTKNLQLNAIRAFPHSAGVDWVQTGYLRKEPRIGTRYVLTGCIDTKGQDQCTRTQIYSLHFEIFCGPLTRLKQLSDAIADAKRCRREFLSGANTVSSSSGGEIPARFKDDVHASHPLYPYHQTQSVFAGSPQYPSALPRHFCIIIGGDLNTIMHGIVRLSASYSDRLRWLSVGETEAEWLQRNVLDLGGSKWLKALWWRMVYGLQPKYVEMSSNNELKLFDVFDKLKDITLDNPAYKGYVTAKLDWLMLSNLMVSASSIGNHDYKLSDHKYLVNEVLLPPFLSPKGIAALGESPLEADSVVEAYSAHPNHRSPITAAAKMAYAGLVLAVLFGLGTRIYPNFA